MHGRYRRALALACALFAAGLLVAFLIRADAALERGSPRAAPQLGQSAQVELTPDRAQEPVGRAVHLSPRPGSAEARVAIASDLEELLGGRVTLRWDKGPALAPRHIRIDGAKPLAGPAVEAARRVLAWVADALGEPRVLVGPGEAVPRAGPALVCEGPLVTRESTIVAFSAVIDSVPIEDSTLKVELRRTVGGLVPTAVAGRFHVAPTIQGRVVPSVEAQLAERYKTLRAGSFQVPVSSRLVAHECADGVHRLAFEVTAATSRTEARREIVDSETGVVLSSYPVTCCGSAQAFAYDRDPSSGRAPWPLSGLYVKKGNRRVVTGADGAFSLTGTVEVDGFAGPSVRVLPDGQDPFVYSGRNDFVLLSDPSDEESVHQDEAAAFRYATSYGTDMATTYPDLAGAALVRFAVVVASDFPNAFFAPMPMQTDDGESFPGYVDLGIIGGNSCARDGSIVEHEYTHALLNGVAYLYGNDEAQGVNEALADYFPCARAENPLIGEWTRPPFVRALDDQPRRLVWPADAESSGMEVHRIGNIFNQALWRARMSSPSDRLQFDQAVLGGVLRMPRSPTLLDAAEAILAADEALNGGSHADSLQSAFAEHGIDVRAVRSTTGDESSGDVAFTEPVRRTFTIHIGETLEVPVAAGSASGAAVALECTALENATFERGNDGSGRLVFTPSDAQRGRQTVTFTATTADAGATRTVTIVVRMYRP